MGKDCLNGQSEILTNRNFEMKRIYLYTLQAMWVITCIVCIIAIDGYVLERPLQQQGVVILIMVVGIYNLYLWANQYGLEKWVFGFHIFLFWVAYLAQLPMYLYLNYGHPGELLLTSFSLPWELGMSQEVIVKAEWVILAGNVGVLVSALFLKLKSRKEFCVTMFNEKLKCLPDAGKIFYLGLVMNVVSAFPRKILNIQNPLSENALPFKLGGMINLLNSQVSIYIMVVGISLAAISGTRSRARIFSIMFVMVGIVQYMLFWSKWYIIGPLFFVLATGAFFNVKLIAKKHMFLMLSIFISVYPLLNVYRSVHSDGNTKILDFSSVLAAWMFQQAGNGPGYNLLLAGVTSFWARLVGLEPLMVVLETIGKLKPSITTIVSADFKIDDYLTYNVIQYKGAMGYDAGFLGRVFFTFGDYMMVALVVSIWVYIAISLLRSLRRSGDIVLIALLPAVYIKLLLISISGPKVDELIWGVSSFLAAWLIVRSIISKPISIAKTFHQI